MQHPKYRADIDGLRAIAVLSVVGFHAFPNLIKGGFIGVDIFFVISGFLISTIIFGGLSKNDFNYVDFYIRRIRRIFPALLIVLAACCIFGWFTLMSDDYASFGKHMAAGGGFVANIALWMESNYFDTQSKIKPLLHLWSLGIEEQFYIIWPILAGMAWRYRFSFLILASVTIAMTFAVCLWDTSNNPTAGYYSPLSRFWELGAGGVLAWICLYKQTWLSIRKNWQSGIGFILVLAGLFFIDKYTAFPGWVAWLPVLGSFLLISAGQDAWLNKNILARKGMVGIGLISYPLYLWHWPLLSFAYILEGADKLPRMTRIVCVAASFILAWLTYHFIEKPLKKTTAPRSQATTLAVSMGIVIAAGVVIFTQNGFGERIINKDPRKVFIKEYRVLHTEGLFSSYHEECNFYEYKTDGAKEKIDDSCIQPGNKETYLLWGDSHAQALSAGIRHLLASPAVRSEIALAQVTASGCRPALKVIPKNGANIKACTLANEFAVAQIKKLRPAIVIAVQAALHEKTDWNEIADFVALNGGKLIVMGPTPRWMPSLPDIVVQEYWEQDYKYIDKGIDKSLFKTDLQMKETYKGSSKLTYISALDRLCNNAGCLAKIKTDSKMNLFAVDGEHLSPIASDYVATEILRNYLK